MKTIEKTLEIPAAASVMAAKIVGRVIGQCARGFGDDESLVDEVSVYLAIQERYPKETVPLRTMFNQMLANASDDSEEDEALKQQMAEMSEQERALWANGEEVTEKAAIRKAQPVVTKIFLEAKPDLQAFYKLPVVAQWSLLNYTEAALPAKIARYTQWADDDRAARKRNTNAMKLEAAARTAVTDFALIVTEFLKNKEVKAALAVEADSGVNVPERLVG